MTHLKLKIFLIIVLASALSGLNGKGDATVTLDPSTDTIVGKSDSVTFTPTVTGTSGTPTFSWDFGGDGATPPTSTSPSAVPVTFSTVGKDYNVTLTVTDTLNGKVCSTCNAKVKITLPTITDAFSADSTGPGSINWIPAGSTLSSGSITVKTEADITTTPVAKSHNFGPITASDSNTTLDPTTFTSDANGKGTIKVTSNSQATALKLTIQKQDSDPHSMLPAQFVDTFTVTYYSTFNEADFSGNTVSDTTQRASGASPKRYYYIHSNVPAKSDFLGTVAIEGYGYTVNSVLLKPISTTRIAAPNPLPAGTDSSYIFDDVVIDSTTGLPLGNSGHPLRDGISSAVAVPNIQIPSSATFNCGDGTRTVDDTGSAIGSLHIDAYIIASQKVVNQSTRQNAQVTLISTP